mgnify:CR=1 FL=1
MNSANRVILNTASIYLSTLIKIFIGFFSVRLILQALGQVDYGISTVVGGVIATLDILSLNMSNTSMRFISHTLGCGNIKQIKKVFSATVFLHYVIALISILVLEVGGWIMFEFVLDIPSERLFAAHVIYQFSIVSAIISIIAVPFDAVMNAHEHLWVMSLFNILSSILSLLTALFLLLCTWDRLIIWGICNLLIQIVLRLGKVMYSKKHFEECRITKLREVTKSDVMPMLSFTGWSMFGNLSSMAVTQLRGIVLNPFFGVRLNASEGIAKSVTNYVNQISMAIIKAINPQIMKSEGEGNRRRMVSVVEIGAKYSSFLFSLVAVPLLFEVDYLLKIWLLEVPGYAGIFCKLILIDLLVDKFSNQINQAIYAVGNIKKFQVIESSLALVYLPVILVLFKFGAPPPAIYYAIIATTLLKYIDRFYFGKKLAEINVLSYLKNAIVPVLLPTSIGLLCIIPQILLYVDSFVRLVLIFLSYIVISTLFFYIIMPKNEKKKWQGIIMSLRIRKNSK